MRRPNQARRIPVVYRVRSVGGQDGPNGRGLAHLTPRGFELSFDPSLLQPEARQGNTALLGPEAHYDFASPHQFHEVGRHPGPEVEGPASEREVRLMGHGFVRHV